MRKKIGLMLISTLLGAMLLSACQKKMETVESRVSKAVTEEKPIEEKQEEKKIEEKISIVTTIFPEYDWVKEIIGEKAERFTITPLFDKGVDLHSYQPTAEDIAKISKSDLFIYVGGESDEWAEKALEGGEGGSLQAINLVETLGDAIKTEEIIEGMQHSHGDEEDDDHDEEGHEHESHKHEDDHEHDHDEKEEGHDHDHDHGEEHHHHDLEKDEHVWLSLKHAMTLVKAISDKIILLDPENKDVYQLNTDNYIKNLQTSDSKFAEVVKKAENKTLLFGDRFPFRYLVDDYGLKYYAAFSGCSAETEASFETVAFLSGKVDELGLKKLLVLENSNGKLAKTIVESTKEKNQEVLILNSMQSVTKEDIEKGLSYLSVMEENLNLIEAALQ